MSGFVGILNLDGTPVDCALLKRMTNFLAFRGPDAQEVWCGGPVGLGHALLQIPSGSRLEIQPSQLDGRLWIIADARIDGRKELIEKLKGKNPAAYSISLSTSDAELILHAYDAWGESCVEHLLGDFSFAIWDNRNQRLFCARDQLGVKLCYYSRIGSCLIFSNTLNCILTNPGVSKRLNDLAIADFLLFDANQDPSTTSFTDIQALAPAHSLTCEQSAISTRRFWEFVAPAPIYFSSEEECVERFRELLDLAVADRVRGGTAGVMMSGGLDSTAIAVSAQRTQIRRGTSNGVRAYTEVFDTLVPHKERHYATLAANALKIPIEYMVSDSRRIFERGEESGYCLPRPIHLAWPDTTTDQLKQIAAFSRVALTGMGADPAFSSRITVHFRELIHEGQFHRSMKDAVFYLTRPGRLSRLYLRTRWRILFPTKSHSQHYPEWLNPDLEKSLSLRTRRENPGGSVSRNGSVRPEACEAVFNLSWANYFQSMDPETTQLPVEICHPFFDLRLLNFLLALPRLPWCCDKELLRENMRGSMPDAVRLRRKTSMPGDPLIGLLQRPESKWVDTFQPITELGKYVCRERIAPVYLEAGPWKAWVNLRPLSLNLWLRLRGF
jgi:asparagine synthase (glutamine-hydrolysing)